MSLSPFGGVRHRTAAKRVHSNQYRHEGWIGVDLDGTLAHYDKWLALTHIGEPVIPVLQRVRQKLAEGYEVKLFTARVHGVTGERLAEFMQAWTRWSQKHIGVVLSVTCIKDSQMIEMWDDRAVTVEKNTGRMARYEDGELQEL